jgi:hypothetical protein
MEVSHTVQGRGVRCVPKRPEDQHVSQAELVRNYSEERTAEDHDTERQRVGAIDKVRLLLSTCTDIYNQSDQNASIHSCREPTIERVPDPGLREADQSHYDNIEEWTSIPSCESRSRFC